VGIFPFFILAHSPRRAIAEKACCCRIKNIILGFGFILIY